MNDTSVTVGVVVAAFAFAAVVMRLRLKWRMHTYGWSTPPTIAFRFLENKSYEKHIKIVHLSSSPTFFTSIFWMSAKLKPKENCVYFSVTLNIILKMMPTFITHSCCVARFCYFGSALFYFMCLFFFCNRWLLLLFLSPQRKKWRITFENGYITSKRDFNLRRHFNFALLWVDGSGVFNCCVSYSINRNWVCFVVETKRKKAQHKPLNFFWNDSIHHPLTPSNNRYELWHL